MILSSNQLPRELYTAAQVRELDRLAIEEHQIAGFDLMNRAGASVFGTVLQHWPQIKHLIVIAGTGNNGGDGFVVATLAKEHGLNVEVFLLGAEGKIKGDALLALRVAQKQQVSIADFEAHQSILEAANYPQHQTVIVDALLGTGLSGQVRQSHALAIQAINDSGLPVVAVDIPSGLCSDTGALLGHCVLASNTVTFIGVKQGLLTCQGPRVCGDIVYDSLDIPDQVFESPSVNPPASRRIDIRSAKDFCPPRIITSHKGDYGHVMVVGGDYGYGGAAIMAAQAASRTGAGLVSMVTRSVNVGAILSRCPEIMVYGTEQEGLQGTPREKAEQGKSFELSDTIVSLVGSLAAKANVIVIGPGLGQSPWSRQLLQLILQVHRANNIPMVADADALNLLADRKSYGRGSGKKAATVMRRNNWVMTPHPGEAARLLDCTTKDIHANRFQSVKELQSRWGGACLLKGAGSLLCYEDSGVQVIDLCTEGNPGMATGGMGDVLTGVIAGFIAQGNSLEDSLRCGVCVHGESADLATQSLGQRGLMATDLLPFIRQLVNPT